MAGATQFCPSDLCQGDEKSADNTSLLARALKMHRCKSVGQNRHVSLPCMPHELREVRMLSLRQNKNSSFPGHAPGKDTLRAANAATKEGFTGRKRVKRKRLPVVFPSFPERGGQRGRKRVKRKRLPVVVPVKIKIPVASADMRRHSDTLRGAQRRRKRGSRGENGLSVSDYPLSSRLS